MNNEEEKKGDENAVMSIADIVVNQIAARPWQESEQKISDKAQAFNKRKCLMKMLAEL